METILDMLYVIFENASYVFSLSFQLAAAWLLVGNTVVTREGIIKAYCNQHKGGLPFDKTGKLLDCVAWETTVKDAWINRVAFFFLGLGYLINIFGNCSMEKEYALLIIVALTAALVIIPTNIAKKKSKMMEPPCLNEIPLVDGVQIEIVGDEEYQKDELLK